MHHKGRPYRREGPPGPPEVFPPDRRPPRRLEGLITMDQKPNPSDILKRMERKLDKHLTRSRS